MRLEARTYQFKTKLNRMGKVSNKHQTATDAYTVLAVRLMEEFNQVIKKHGWNPSTGSIVCDTLKKEFPQYKFDTRVQGWEWFFIEDLWVRFFFGKNYCETYYITHFDRYEPFHKANS